MWGDGVATKFFPGRSLCGAMPAVPGMQGAAQVCSATWSPVRSRLCVLACTLWSRGPARGQQQQRPAGPGQPASAAGVWLWGGRVSGPGRCTWWGRAYVAACGSYLLTPVTPADAGWAQPEQAGGGQGQWLWSPRASSSRGTASLLQHRWPMVYMCDVRELQLVSVSVQVNETYIYIYMSFFGQGMCIELSVCTYLPTYLPTCLPASHGGSLRCPPPQHVCTCVLPDTAAQPTPTLPNPLTLVNTGACRGGGTTQHTTMACRIHCNTMCCNRPHSQPRTGRIYM